MTSKDTHDPGWNDPPIFTYDKTAATQAVANKKGIFLNKRVAFPISSNMGNNAKMNSLSGMDLSKPPLMSQPPLMSEPSREKLETTPKKDIKMGSKERLEKIIKNLKIDTNYDEEIVKRIKIMEKMWTDGKLEDKVQHQVFELSEVLNSEDIFKKPKMSDPVTFMDVDDCSKNVMASSGTVGSVSVSLHPLVIMNISEHWTRLRAQEGTAQQVIGAVIGKQKGRNIEIMNSFELVYNVVDGDVIIDRDYYSTKEEQFKQVFSDMDFLGWYTSGDVPDDRDIKIHKQICEINESPVLLKLNPTARHSDLPVTMYESVIDLLNGEATMLFVQLHYTLATEEAERIGVDHVARVSTNEAGESSLVAEHLTAQHSAIKMLHSRVKLVLEYVKAVQEGKLPENNLNHHEILREAYSLSHRLPVLQTSQFSIDLYNQCNDVGLMAYLGTMTKGCNDINQLINKFNVIYDRQGIGRRMRGLFF